MKAWSLFYPDTLPDLPGAPLPVVDHWLRNAAIEFCERSKVLVVDLTAMSAVADQMSYAITLASNTELVELISVKFSGEVVTPKSPAYLEAKYGDWQAETGTPEHYTQQDTANVLLVPAPAAAETGAIKLKVATKPGTAATGVEDWFFSQYRLAIVAGAKGKLMLMDGKPWSNPDRAAFNLALFEGAISTATGRTADGHVRARPRFSGSFC